MITPSQTATSYSGARVKLKGDTNCRTQNVVYLISCGKCGKQYVGETKGPLNIRMNGHRDDWRHKRFEISPVGQHFCDSGKSSSGRPQYLGVIVLTIAQKGMK